MHHNIETKQRSEAKIGENEKKLKNARLDIVKGDEEEIYREKI